MSANNKPQPGSICTDAAQHGRRDAFHAACVMVKSQHTLRAGDCDAVNTNGDGCRCALPKGHVGPHQGFEGTF